MKKYNHITITAIVSLIVLLLLQGCIVVGIGNRSMWNYDKSTRPDTNEVQVTVNIQKPNLIIPIPFFLLNFDKKEYSVTIYVNTRTELYQSLDSVRYRIYDLNCNLIRSDVTSYSTKNFKCMGTIPNCPFYQVGAETEPIIKLPKDIRKQDILFEYELYFHGVDTPIYGTCTLDVAVPPKIWTSFFYKM